MFEEDWFCLNLYLKINVSIFKARIDHRFAYMPNQCLKYVYHIFLGAGSAFESR